MTSLLTRTRPPRSGPPPSLVATAVAGAVGCGVLAAASPRLGLALALALVTLFAVRLLRLSTVELVVVTMPFMFFPPIGFLLNVSVADFLMPVLVVATWPRVRDALDPVRRGVLRRFTGLSAVLLFVIRKRNTSRCNLPPTYSLAGVNRMLSCHCSWASGW